MRRRYVTKDRTPHAMPIPKDEWRGDTFVEGSTGVQLEVVWNGHRDGPSLCGDRFEQNRRVPSIERGRIHLSRGRA